VTFVLRTVSTSAQGREIVRTRRIDGDRLSIGRDPSSDVHLTDLAVALHHVRVERRGERLLVTAEPGLFVALNSRQTGQGAIDLAAGGDLRIGSHLLRFLPTAAGSDEIDVSVERVSEGETKLDRDADRLFSLASVLPGKRAMAWGLVILILAIGLVLPFKAWSDRQQRLAQYSRYQADEIWSAGHLSKAHANLQHNCSACHVRPFESVRDTACVACHKGVHGHADPFRLARAQPHQSGFARVQLGFKRLFNLPPGRCIDCHREHEGAEAMPPTPQHFCSACHGDLHSRLPDTRIGDVADFGVAHPEFRPTTISGWNGEQPALRRMSMASHPRETSGLKFPHALHLSKVGGVAQMSRRLGMGQALECSSCHHPDQTGVRFLAVQMERDCAMCHSLAFARVDGTVRTLRHGDPAQVIADLRDFYRVRTAPLPPSLSPFARRMPGSVPHARAQIQFDYGARMPTADAAIRAVFSRGGACYDCHTIEPPPAGSIAYHVHPVALATRYFRHGWFDHRAHAAVPCASCHAATRSSSATDLLVPGIDTCRSCHGGERTSKPVASTCAMCHDYHAKEGAPTMIVRRLGGRQSIARMDLSR
jgi:hypothetical protein